MLKSEMEEKILSLELKLEEEEKTQAFTSARLAVMLERVDEYDRLIVIKDKALCAIKAIRVTSCRDEIPPRIRQHLYEEARCNDKPEPNLPPLGELYVTLEHIESILRKPVEEHKPDSRFSQY